MPACQPTCVEAVTCSSCTSNCPSICQYVLHPFLANSFSGRQLVWRLACPAVSLPASRLSRFPHSLRALYPIPGPCKGLRFSLYAHLFGDLRGPDRQLPCPMSSNVHKRLCNSGRLSCKRRRTKHGFQFQIPPPSCSPSCMPSCTPSCMQQSCPQQCQPMCTANCVQQYGSPPSS